MDKKTLMNRALNTPTMLNFLGEDVIDKIEFHEVPSVGIDVIKIFMNASKEKIERDMEEESGMDKMGHTISDETFKELIRNYLYYNFKMDPSWWHASIIPKRIYRVIGLKRPSLLSILVVDKDGKFLFDEVGAFSI